MLTYFVLQKQLKRLPNRISVPRLNCEDGSFFASSTCDTGGTPKHHLIYYVFLHRVIVSISYGLVWA